MLKKLLLTLSLLALLAGCHTVPKTNQAYELFPAALVAEPIQMRAGYEHTTQPFEITSPKQAWDVSIGFARRDAVTPVKQFFCWIEPRGEVSFRRFNNCTNNEPGISLRWELIDSQGKTLVRYSYDALKQDTGGTYAGNAVTKTLSGFANFPSGTYRLKVTVLRDFPELDAHSPHILVNLPFFRKN